jgi:hypothetical protein
MKSIRELNLDEMMERELVQERLHKFWEPEDKKEAAGFLAVELMDDLDLSDLLFDMCSNSIENKEKILEVAERLVIRAQAAIYQHAINDKLPITILTVDPEDARAMARGQI